MTTPLYHVGCGQQLFTLEQAEHSTMAMACSCGALSPIMVTALDEDELAMAATPVWPSSLVQIFEAKLKGETNDELPHLEYYLGFSELSFPAKEDWKKTLRELGLTPMSECSEAGCIEMIKRRSLNSETSS